MQQQAEFDGRLDQTHAWQNHGPNWQSEQDRISWMRSFDQGPRANRRMQIAEWASNPDTPAAEIRQTLVNPFMPPRVGYDRTEPTIGQVLNISAPESHSLFDYSGTPAGQQSSSRPALGAML